MTSTIVWTSSREASARRESIVEHAETMRAVVVAEAERALRNRIIARQNVLAPCLRNMLAASNGAEVSVGVKVRGQSADYRCEYIVWCDESAWEVAGYIASTQITEGDVEAWANYTTRTEGLKVVML